MRSTTTRQMINGFLGLKPDYSAHTRARTAQKNDENVLGMIISNILNEKEREEEAFLGCGCGYANVPNNKELKRLRIIEENRNAVDSPKDYKRNKQIDPSKTYTL